MKYAVLGAGAIGGSIAAALCQNGQEVWLVDPNKAITEAIQKDGLKMDVALVQFAPADLHFEVHPHAVCTPEEIDGTVDVVFLAIKGIYTRGAMEGLKAITGKDTIFISAQNGIGNEDIMAEAFGAERVAYTTVQLGGRVVAPGHLDCNVTTITVEKMNGHLPMTPMVDGNQFVINILKRVGREGTNEWFDMRYLEKPALDKMRWGKLILNAVVNSIGAVTEGCMDSQQSLQSGVDYGEKIMAEGLAVAHAYGVDLSRSDIHLPDKVCPKVTEGYRHYTSMCMDVVNHRLTENEFICGPIVRGGKKFGIDTPYNQAIYWLINVIEHTYEDRYTVYSKKMA